MALTIVRFTMAAIIFLILAVAISLTSAQASEVNCDFTEQRLMWAANAAFAESKERVQIGSIAMIKGMEKQHDSDLTLERSDQLYMASDKPFQTIDLDQDGKGLSEYKANRIQVFHRDARGVFNWTNDVKIFSPPSESKPGAAENACYSADIEGMALFESRNSTNIIYVVGSGSQGRKNFLIQPTEACKDFAGTLTSIQFNETGDILSRQTKNL
jgi:hypothetical protein